jgi:hypothetical protein
MGRRSHAHSPYFHNCFEGMTMFQIKSEQPTQEEAMRRYEEVLGDTWVPPLSDEEKENIKAQCLAGGPLFIRCTFEPAPSDIHGSS